MYGICTYIYHKIQPNVGKYMYIYPCVDPMGNEVTKWGGGMPDIFLNHTIFDMENPGTWLKFLQKPIPPGRFQ